MVKVNTNSNTIKVNAASAGRASNLSIGTPQSYYDGLAKEWAISDNLVQGIDYSSKYYANIAKSNADSSKANLDSVRDAAEEVIAAKDNALNDISDAKINTLESLIDEGNNQIELIKEQGSSYATKEDAKYTAGNGIDITDNIISNTQTSAEWGNITGNIENQEDLVNYVKKYSGGLEVCDIGMSLYIDETKGLRRWLNGQIVAINQNTQGFLTRLKKIVALYPSLLTTEENWQAAKTLSAFGQVGKFVFNYAQAEVEKQCSIFGGEDILTSEENYWLVEKAKNDVEVGDLAYPCDSSGTKTGDDAAAITAVWTGTYTGEPIISITESGNNGKSFYSEVTLTETVTTDEIVSFRLPAVINIQGVFDLQNAGLTVEAGLPNITGTTNQTVSGNTDDFTTEWIGAIKTDFITGTGKGLAENNWTTRRLTSRISLDASHLNPTYGASDTVQEEAIQYPYYIQIATGQETEVNITNEIELNNPFFFGMSNYFKFKPNNLSWLKSAGYDEPKAAHPDYYNWILENVNKGVKGFKGQEGYCFIATDSSGYYWWVSTESPVVGASVYRYDAGVNSMFFDGTVETLTSNGFTFTSIFEGSSYTVTRDSSKDTSILHPTAWITDNDFKINTSDETFRLPLKNGTEGMFGGGAVVGNGMSLGLTNGSQTAGLTSLAYHAGVTDSGTLIGVTTGYGLNIGQSVAGSAGFQGIVTAGITTDPEKSGLVVANAGVVPDGWALYYYVGATVQNANLIDAGRMQEQITNINAPSRGYLVQSYVNGSSWYRVYSDGWCEQGGKITVGLDASVSVTFLKPFMNASYYANWISCNGETQNGEGTRACDNLTTTSMRIYNGQDCAMLANWYACGY